MTAVATAPLLGSQTPRLFTPPLRELTPASSLGFEAVRFADDVLGITLMPWQRWLLEHMLELNPDGTFRFRTVLIQVARQNGKSTLAQVLSLWRMFVDRSPLVIGTAQNLDVAEEVWTGAVEMAEGTPELLAEIAAVERTNGKKALRLTGGERYKVAAASRRGGRGLSGDLVLLDEIREHRTWDAWAAVTKTTMARPRPQIVALSNAGDSSSVVLNHLRTLGLATLDGGDPSIGFFEWSAPEGCDLDDRDGWMAANPALGHTITEQSIAAALATDPEPIFRTEVLCQQVAEIEPRPIPEAAWVALARNDAIVGPVAVAVEVTMKRDESFVWVCGANSAGVPQVECAEVRDGTDWVSERVGELIERHEVLAVGCRSGGPAASLLPELRGVCADAQTEFVAVNSAQFAGMCGSFFDAVMTGGLAHRSDPRLNSSVAAAKRHQQVDAWTWERTRVDTDAAPLVAATGAYALFMQHSRRAEYDPLDNLW